MLLVDKTGAKFLGLQDVVKRLESLPQKLQKTVIRRSFRKVGRQLLRAIKSRAPRSRMSRGPDTLAKSMGISLSRKHAGAWVGLKKNYYYKTLDLSSMRGAPLNPWFANAWQANRAHVKRAILRQISLDIQFEAGKNYAKSRRIT